jgi:hypothetical protein
VQACRGGRGGARWLLRAVLRVKFITRARGTDNIISDTVPYLQCAPT